MRVLADTSFFVAALLESHPHHDRAYAWVQRVVSREIELAICSHSIAETYAVLTGFPTSPRIQPGAALQMISENVLHNAKIIDLTPKDYQRAVTLSVERGLVGGAIYDVLVAVAFEKSKADSILTFNFKHFSRLFPTDKKVVVVP